MKSTSLVDSAHAFHNSKITDTVDIHCVNDSGTASVYMNNVEIWTLAPGEHFDFNKNWIGYDSGYILSSSGSVTCTVQEYASSPIVQFATD